MTPFRAGMLLVAAAAARPTEKTALPTLGQAIVWGSLAGGVPLGLLAHGSSRAVSRGDPELNALYERIRNYQEAQALLRGREETAAADAEEDGRKYVRRR